MDNSINKFSLLKPIFKDSYSYKNKVNDVKKWKAEKADPSKFTEVNKLLKKK